MNNYARSFPLLSKTINGTPITYLDSASTTPKPQAVIDAVSYYYTDLGANVHRGVHPLSEQATEAFEQTRYAIASLINASPAEIIFVRNATEAFNLVSQCLNLKPDDEIILTASEHHSNFLPWQSRATLKLIDVDDEGVGLWEEVKKLFNPKTRLLTVGHISNVTGVIAPVGELSELAHLHDVPIMIDASQSISHLPIDVKKIGCDFMGFSSHKMFGPSGVGVLYVNQEKYKNLNLFNLGGGMVLSVEEKSFTPLEPPFSYEPGTPNIEGVIGLGAAVNYLNDIGLDDICKHNQKLTQYCLSALRELPAVKILGDKVSPENRIAICAFSLKDSALSHTHIAQLLGNSQGILISAGTHCAHVLHRQTDLAGTLRVSAHIFNDTSDIDKLFNVLKEIV